MQDILAAETNDGFITANSRELKTKIKKTFAANFNRIIEDKAVSQTEVGKRIGMMPYEINKYARGTLTITPNKLQSIAEALEVDPDELVPGYVTKAKKKRLGVRLVTLENGNVWIEYGATFDPETANEMLALIAKNKIGEGPDSEG